MGSLRTIYLALGLLVWPACAPSGGASGTASEPDGSLLARDGDPAIVDRGDAASSEPPIAVVSSRTGVEGGTQGGTVVPATMVQGRFALPEGGLHTSLEGSMRVEVDPGTSTFYFFGQQFWFDGGDGAFMGLQTNGEIGDGTLVGKMAIVSIWQAVASTPGPGATCIRFGNAEGESCRLRFAWRPDVAYHFRVAQVAEDRWRVSILAAGAEATVLGTFTVPPAFGLLEPSASTFTMYYGQVGSCATVPLAQLRFGDVNADDGAVVPVRVEALTYGDCAAAATASCTGDACAVP